MPAGEPRQVVAELEADGAAQRGRTGETDLPAQRYVPSPAIARWRKAIAMIPRSTSRTTNTRFNG